VNKHYINVIALAISLAFSAGAMAAGISKDDSAMRRARPP